MKKLFFCMTLIVATLATSHAGAPEQCGDVPSSAPIVALNDVNPSSDTYGQTIDTSQFLGGTWVIYWAQSS